MPDDSQAGLASLLPFVRAEDLWRRRVVFTQAQESERARAGGSCTSAWLRTATSSRRRSPRTRSTTRTCSTFLRYKRILAAASVRRGSRRSNAKRWLASALQLARSRPQLETVLDLVGVSERTLVQWRRWRRRDDVRRRPSGLSSRLLKNPIRSFARTFVSFLSSAQHSLSSKGDTECAEHDQQTGHLFSYLSPEQRVPANHPLRAIRDLTDAALRTLSPQFAELYARTGRPSIPPEQLPRALLL